MMWYGHLMRLPKETPARTALQEAKRKVKQPRGKPRLTWLKLVEKDLGDMGITGDGNEQAQNRQTWRSLVGRTMSAYADGKHN